MLKRALQALVIFYQRYISPAFPPSCRYYPSCSSYMLRALDKHGLVKGLMMGTSRILRCHPFARGGFDPVPDHFTLRRNRRNDLPEAEKQALIADHQRRYHH